MRVFDFFNDVIDVLFIGSRAVGGFAATTAALAIEVGSEVIETGGGAAIDKIKRLIKSRSPYKAAEQTLRTLVSNLNAEGKSGEEFLDTLIKELKDGGILGKRVKGKGVRAFDKLFLESLDFNLDKLERLKCVKALSEKNRELVRVAFKQLQQVFIEFYKHTLGCDQLTFMQVMAYRIDALTKERFDTFREWFTTEFIKGFGVRRPTEFVSCCPNCGAPTEYDGKQTALCPNCGIRYMTYAYSVEENPAAQALMDGLNCELYGIKKEITILEERLALWHAEDSRAHGEMSEKLDEVLRYFKNQPPAKEESVKPKRRVSLWSKKSVPILISLVLLFGLVGAWFIFSGEVMIDGTTGIEVGATAADKSKTLTVTPTGVAGYTLSSIVDNFKVKDDALLKTRAFDISLVSSKGEYGADGKLSVSIPLTEYELAYKDNVTVFYQGTGGAELVENSRVVGGRVEFEVDHLSVYIVALVPFSVEFVDGDAVLGEYSVLHGGEIEAPTVSKAGCDFLGWTFRESDRSAVAGERVFVTESRTYVANFTPKTYTVTLDTCGGSALGNINCSYGAQTQAPASPTRAGYDFVGWEFSKEGFNFGDVMPAEDITATAVWVYKSVHYDSGDNGEKYRIEASDKMVIVIDSINISELSPFFSDKYELTFSFEMCMREVYAGYQEVFLINGDNAGAVRGYKVFEYGGGGSAYKAWGTVRWQFTVSGENCTDIMRLRFGAYGDFSDDWYRRWVHATVTVSEK